MAKINIDFQILPTYNPKTILVVDTSDWAHIEGKPSIIEILLPGEVKPVVQFFDKYKVNKFNSTNLGTHCETCSGKKVEHVNLPDGIYHFTVKGSPDKFSLTKQFIRTDNTRLDLDSFINSVNLNCNDFSKDIIDRIQKINFFIEAAESNTRMGNYCEAQETLFKAQKMISKLKGCNLCV